MTQLPITMISEQDRKNLLHLKKQLRRLKRRLFLEAVNKPVTNVDKFRHLILNLALDDSSMTAGMSSFHDSFQTLQSIETIKEEVRFCDPVG